MNILISNLRSKITDPATNEELKASATEQLVSIAADEKNPRHIDARLVIEELSIEGGIPSGPTLAVPFAEPALKSREVSYVVGKAKAVVNSPSASPEEKAEAWERIKDPATAFREEVSALESTLLTETGKVSIVDVPYQDIQKFCTASGWKEPAVRSLFFDRWFPVYASTPEGAEKMRLLEEYGLTHNAQMRGEQPNTDRIAVLTLARKRLRTSPGFADLLAKKDPELLAALTKDIFADEGVVA
ncbi:MAG TPA: hypothetical protein VFA74_09235 [Terriglobales bacterium]|nr:hypothetical protein [Terriglobales bacterium]